ncbi:kelch-like protein 6 [Drosophila erecta]|uniref:kelch-like protein 6 n=1 Tax=Drosophila erecta TaxID=7220 RepID=UPI000F063407|nr:kelch-like protein 6 [Drosophila erecta]
MSDIFEKQIMDKDKDTRNEENPNEESPSDENHSKEYPTEEPATKKPPSEKSSHEDMAKSNWEERIISNSKPFQVPEDTEGNELYDQHRMQLPTGKPFPLENPFDLRVGNFENILDELNANKREICYPKIPLEELAKKVDPDETIAHTLDKRWFKFTGPPRKVVGEVLLAVFQKNLRPGLIVVVEENHFRCHAMVLQVLSNFFQQPELALSHLFQLPSPMVTAPAFVAMYRWGLEPAERVPAPLLMQVLRAAVFFDCQELVDNCWVGINEGTRFPDRTLCIYLHGNLMGMRLEECLLERLSCIFLQFAASKEYLDLGADTVQRLLGLSSLAVNSEMEVFLAAVLWLNHKWPQRIKFSYIMMDEIRFDWLPFAFLLCMRKKLESGPPVLKMLSRAQYIRKKVYSALKVM